MRLRLRLTRIYLLVLGSLATFGCAAGSNGEAGDENADGGIGGLTTSTGTTGNGTANGGSTGGSGSSSGGGSTGGGGSSSGGGSVGGAGSPSGGGSAGSTGSSSEGGSGSSEDAGSSGQDDAEASPGTEIDGSGVAPGAPSVGGVPGGQISVGTTLAGCEIFPSDNPWNVEVDGPGVQVVHTYDAQLPQTTALHPDWGGYTTNIGGIPFNVADGGQADLPTVFSAYAYQSDPGPGGWVGANPVSTDSDTGTTAYPFFVGMQIEGNPGPGGGTPGSLPSDQHGLVLLQGASGCTSYEAWNCLVVSSPPFGCANGAVFDLTSDALRPLGWTSADTAGLSVLAGLVKLSEVQAGLITHAIRVTFKTTQNGYILPATHAAGTQPLGSAYPPMGLRLRLKANTPTSSYTAASQVILAAMLRYGLIVADNGSDWYFQGDSNDGWNATAPDGQDTLINEIVADFRNLNGSDFEAVYTGDPVATGL